MGFFKAYDMRGTYGRDFDLDTVYRVGRALPRVVGGGRWLIGRDARVSGAAIRDALLAGLIEAGAEVTDLGLCTTPMVYFFTARDGFAGSVMITASHNPPADNGLKVSCRTALPVGYETGLGEVERMIAADEARYSPGAGSSGPGAVPAAREYPEARRLYLDWMRARFAGAEGLRYAVDCSNGMAALLAAELFPGATILNGTIDGTFPGHGPNPLLAENRRQLADCVREQGLDCGLVFDGDADRCMFVDERGDFIQPDYLIPIVAQATAGSRASSERLIDLPEGGAGVRVIHDVRTSRGAIEVLRRNGCEPKMVPVGHAFAKPALRRLGALCGGELAGHYYFAEFAGCDSGVLAACRVLDAVARAKSAGGTFSGLMAPIVSRYANSGELNFRVADKDAAIRRVLATAAADLPPERARSEMDGIRLEFDDGWINIRKSNTEPYLRLIAECRTAEELENWLAKLKTAIGD